MWANLGIAIVLGLCFASLGFLGHEILHGTVVRKAWLRDFLGAIAFMPLSTGPKLWRKWHNATHHVHTQHEENDPDAWPTLEKLKKSKFLSWVYRMPLHVRSFFSFLSLTIQFTLHSTRMFFHFIKEFKSSNQNLYGFNFFCLGQFGLVYCLLWDLENGYLHMSFRC